MGPAVAVNIFWPMLTWRGYHGRQRLAKFESRGRIVTYLRHSPSFMYAGVTGFVERRDFVDLLLGHDRPALLTMRVRIQDQI